MRQATQESPIFLSYALEDTHIALELAVALKIAGLPIWLDKLDVLPELEYCGALEQALNNCSGILALVSSRFVGSPYCIREISDAADNDVPILPILLEDINTSVFLSSAALPPYDEFVSDRQRSSFRQIPESLVQYIAKALNIVVRPVVNPEKAYLYRQLGMLELFQSQLDLLVLGARANRSSLVHRPRLRFIQNWQAPGPFADYSISVEEGKPAVIRREGNMVDVAARLPRFVLTGDLGSGKTAALAQFVISQIHQRISNPRSALYPVYVDMSDWDGDEDIRTYIQRASEFPQALMALIDDDEVILCLDFPAGIYDPHILEAMRLWVDQDAPSRVIIAGCDHFRSVGLPQVELLPLEAKHIDQFCVSYLAEQSEKFARRLTNYDAVLVPQASNPFLLTAMAVIRDHVSEDFRPSTGGILKRYVECAYRCYTDPSSLHLPWNVLQQALARLAFSMVDSGSERSVRVEDAYQLGVIESALRASQRALLVQYTDQGRVRFYNFHVRAYFAALGLRYEGLPTRLSRPQLGHEHVLMPETWDPVVIMLAGAHEVPDTVVEEVSEVNPYLALACVEDGVQVNDTALMQILHRTLGFYSSHGEDWRVVTIDVLTKLRPNALRSMLLQEARSGAWHFRQAAVDLILQLPFEPIAGIPEALEAQSDKLEQSTIVGLKKLGDSVLPDLLRLLVSESATMRRAAAKVLGVMREGASAPLLAGLVSDHDYQVASEAVCSLGQIGDRQAVAKLTDALRHSDWRVRQSASDALALVGKPAVRHLNDALDDDDDDVRIYAVQALERINDRSALKSLLKASYDHDVEVRGAAIKALGKAEDMDAVNRLIESLSDTSVMRTGKERIRDLAAGILKQMGFVGDAAAYNQSVEPANGNAQVAASDENQPAKGPSAQQGKVRLQRIKGSAQSDRQPLSAEFLKDKDWRVRQAGVLAIPNDADDASAIPILRKALQDDDNQVRVAAVRKLGSLNTENAIGGLLYALRDRDYLVADTAAEIIQSIGKRAIPGLLKLLKSNNVNMRGAAVESLGKIADPIAVQPLVEALDDTARPWLSSDRICDLAANALFAINTPAAINAVQHWRQRELQSHAEQNHVDISKQVTPQMQSYDTDNRGGILANLLDSLRQGEWDQKVEAAKALREYTRAMKTKGAAGTNSLSLLTDQLRDEDWVVRWAVTEAIAWIGDASIVEQLQHLVDDEYWMVRVAVVRAFMEIGDPAAVHALKRAMNDTNSTVREAAAEALGVIGDPGVVSVLQSFSQYDEEEFVRLASVQALAKIDDREVVIALSRAITDTNGHVRWAAVKGLAKWLDESLVPVLIPCLEDTFSPHMEDQRICDVAAEGLEKVDSLQARLAVEHWRQGTSD